MKTRELNEDARSIGSEAGAPLRIATRTTPLALVQTELVAEALRRSGLEVERVELRTLGDRSLGGNLVARRGMFTAELDLALLEGRADLAVHSLKDLPLALDARLSIVAIPERASPCDLLLLQRIRAPADWLPLDALLTGQAEGELSGTAVERAFFALAHGAVIGTSSPRRQAGALAVRPDLVCCAVRGSVGRRLEWLGSGAVDALLLAEAGLARLAGERRSRTLFRDLVACRLEPHAWPPAPGQGALAVVADRSSPWCAHSAVLALAHPETTTAVLRERSLLERLGGGCALPFAAFCTESLTAASLAAEDWRRQASRGAAPRVAWVSQRRCDPVDDLTRSLDELVTAAPPPSPLEQPRQLVVTSSAEAAARLTAELTQGEKPEVLVTNLEVTSTHTLDVEWPSRIASELRAAAPSRRVWPWVLVSSPSAGQVLVERSRREPVWSALPWCALGAGTARALLGLGSPPNLVARARDAEEFAHFASEHLQSASALFLPHSELASGALRAALVALGFELHAFAAYTRRSDTPTDWPSSWRGEPEALLFTSPSAVHAVADGELRLPPRCWALGPSTAAAMKQRGIPLSAIADTPTAQGIANLWLQRPVALGENGKPHTTEPDR